MGKKPAKKKPQGEKYHDHGTELRKQRGDVEIVNNRAFVRQKHPLDYYRGKELITIEQHKAGLRLARDYAISHQHRSMVAMLSELRGIFRNGDENRQTAGDRYTRVMSYISRIGATMAWNIVIEGAYLTEIHNELGFAKQNSGLDRFRECLDEIEEAYKKIDNGKFDEERANAAHNKTLSTSCRLCGWPLTSVKIGIFPAQQCTRNSCGDITGIPESVLRAMSKYAPKKNLT